MRHSGEYSAYRARTDAPVPLTARLRALAPWLLGSLAIFAVVVLLAVR